jgi:hypothetical protein
MLAVGEDERRTGEREILRSMVWKLMTWLRPNALGMILFLPCAVLAQYLPILRPSVRVIL